MRKYTFDLPFLLYIIAICIGIAIFNGLHAETTTMTATVPTNPYQECIKACQELK